MTFDELFNYYTSIGFTKPIEKTEGIVAVAPMMDQMSKYGDLRRPQPPGNDNDNNNFIDQTTPTGTFSFSNFMDSDFIQNQGGIGGLLTTAILGPVGSLAVKGLGNLYSNLQNPNTDMYGQPTPEYQQQLQNRQKTINQNKQYFSGGQDNNDAPAGSTGGGASYSSAASTGAKDGFGYGL